MTVLEQMQEYIVDIEKMRQHLHSHPELSFNEVLTTKIIHDFCVGLHLDIIDTGMNTGVVAVLKGGNEAAVALRADIDAISLNGKPEHLCGHDYHTASLMCAAWYLARNKHLINGDVVFIFQPAEEVTQGAQALMNTNFMSKLEHKPGMIFGIHNRPEIGIGKIGVHHGSLMAGKHNFAINIQGQTGHGGSPHQCKDPIVASAAIINGLQTIISRNINPLDPCVCAVCSVHGGTESNFAPELVRMTGSMRYLLESTFEVEKRRFEELVYSISRAYSCSAEIELIEEVPVLNNSTNMSNMAQRAAQLTVGAKRTVSTPPCLGCEDFSVYGKYMNSFFYFVGSGVDNQENAPWHSPDFKVHGAYLQIAASLYVNSVIEAQKQAESYQPY